MGTSAFDAAWGDDSTHVKRDTLDELWDAPHETQHAGEGVLSRAGSMIGDMVRHVANDPLGAAADVVKAPLHSLYDTFAAGVKGEELHSDLAMLHNRGVVKQDEGVTPKQFVGAAAQTMTNAAFPSIAGGVAKAAGGGAIARILGNAAAGGASGAAYSPDDPLAGAVAGAVLAPTVHAVAKAAGAAGRGVGAGTSRALDVIGRPAETTPLKVGGYSFGSITGAADRAAQRLDQSLTDQGVDFFDVQRQARNATKPAPGSVQASMSRPQPPRTAPTTPMADADPGLVQRIRTALATGQAPEDISRAPDMELPVRRTVADPIEYIRPAEDRFSPPRTPAGDAARAASSPEPLAPRRVLDKPVSLLELGGDAAVRHARGLKTGYPQAETELKAALAPRDANAVERVISHGLDLTGLTSRENGLQLVDDLIAQRAEHARENYAPIFAKYAGQIDHPEFQEIAQTPAGQQAVKRGMTIAANRGEKIGSVSEVMGAPEGIDPADWENMQRLATERGMPLPEGATRIAPTLHQAHYIKLGFDDMLNSAPEPGTGGSGPHNAAAIAKLKSRWLAAMDETAPEYGTARKTFADESDLVRGGDVGRKLWQMHPDEAAKAFGEMSEGARDIARRTGFDALADRVENGPADVEKGVHKPRDLKRIRLLFPDDQSFDAFKASVASEAQMHASGKTIFGNSATADKLADLANVLGAPMEAVSAAVQGRWGRAGAAVAKTALRGKMQESAGALAAEQAKLLTAGADGNADALQTALDRILASRGMNAPGRVGRVLANPTVKRVGVGLATNALLSGGADERRRR
jgi:hypothetical protein